MKRNILDKSKKTILAAALGAAILTAGSPVLAQDMTFFRIASGSAGGTYYPMAGLLAQVISNPPGARTCAKGGNCGMEGLVAIAQSAHGSVANVNSIKWSHGAIDKFREGLTRYSKDVSMIDNSGNHVLSHIYGASGFITHLSSFWPEYPNSIWEALESNNYEKARDLLLGFKFEWINWVRKVVQQTGGEGPFIKVAMELVRLKAGPPRPPSTIPSQELINELDKILSKYKVPREN